MAAVGFLLFASPLLAQSVEIVSPRHLATALGPTKIEVRVNAPDGVEVARLEIRVDGESLVTLGAPPWIAEWDAGDGSRGHQLEAVLFLADGSSTRSAVRTSPLRINESLEINLVNLYPLVLDDSGNYVKGLVKEDFRVLENGQPQTIERFTTEHRPLRVAIVLDTSLSMAKGGRLESAKKSALGFLDVLQTEDEALVVNFSDSVNVVQEITSDKKLLAEAISKAEAKGGTALYDAVWRTSRRLEEFDGRRVMVVLSDGRDEAASGFEPGSLHTIEEARRQAVRSEVMVFAIGLGRDLDREYARDWTRTLGSGARHREVSLKDILESLSVTSGGRLLLSPNAGKLKRAFEAVADDLRNQYSLAYSPSDETKDGKYRTIELALPDRDVQIVVRQGYYAPLAESASSAR